MNLPVPQTVAEWAALAGVLFAAISWLTWVAVVLAKISLELQHIREMAAGLHERLIRVEDGSSRVDVHEHRLDDHERRIGRLEAS